MGHGTWDTDGLLQVACDMIHGTRHMGHGTWDMGHGTWDMGHGPSDPDSGLCIHRSLGFWVTLVSRGNWL